MVGQLQPDNKTIVVANSSSITQPGQSQAFLPAPLKGAYKVVLILTKFNNLKSTAVTYYTAVDYLKRVGSFFQRCSYGVVTLDPKSRVVIVSLGEYTGDGSCIEDYDTDVVGEWFSVAMDNVWTQWPVTIPSNHHHRPTFSSQACGGCETGRM